MPVESAADRAALFNADEFGEPALYIPPKGDWREPIACTIVYDMGRDEPFEVRPTGDSGMRGRLAWKKAMLLRDDVPEPVQGGQLKIGGEKMAEIAAKPKLDETGAIWRVELQER